MSKPSTPLASVAAEPSVPLTYKAATEEWEFEQIHRLNHKTFAEEIPQHSKTPANILIDRFHDENTYFICLKGDRVLGMVAARDKRPFSLDQKIHDLDDHLPKADSICEVRLLSIEKAHRKGRVIKGLLAEVARHCIERQYDLLIISGNVQEQRFYTRLGFEPFGPSVGTPEAPYQPMYLTAEGFQRGRFRPEPAPSAGGGPVNLLPGPVAVSREVRAAFARAPVSHRSSSFVDDLGRTKRLLCDLVATRHVEVLMGSGTLANDVIAGQLSLRPGNGLVLSNGEFGERLVDHAGRMNLTFETLRADWGATFDEGEVRAALDRSHDNAWVWAVHCETSTGVLNDIEMLKQVCAERKVRLCLDCISSIGTIPVDLRDVYLASGVSGKGLAAFPGLSMVFYNHQVSPAAGRLPRYLDLGIHATKNGVPFTTSSNLVYALHAALSRFQSDGAFDDVSAVSTWLKGRLRDLGFSIVADGAHASPAVITIALPARLISSRIGARLEEAGYLLSYNSDYLLERNWIQICLMGESSRETIESVLDALPQLRDGAEADAGPRGPR